MLERSGVVRHGVLRRDEFSAAGVDIGGRHDTEKVLENGECYKCKSVFFFSFTLWGGGEIDVRCCVIS